jgi:hypothetical protein
MRFEIETSRMQSRSANNLATTFGSSFVVPHQNVVLYSVNVHEFFVIAYGYGKKKQFHSLVGMLNCYWKPLKYKTLVLKICLALKSLG